MLSVDENDQSRESEDHGEVHEEELVPDLIDYSSSIEESSKRSKRAKVVAEEVITFSKV